MLFHFWYRPFGGPHPPAFKVVLHHGLSSMYPWSASCLPVAVTRGGRAPDAFVLLVFRSSPCGFQLRWLVSDVRHTPSSLTISVRRSLEVSLQHPRFGCSHNASWTRATRLRPFRSLLVSLQHPQNKPPLNAQERHHSAVHRDSIFPICMYIVYINSITSENLMNMIIIIVEKKKFMIKWLSSSSNCL